ncbi:TonB-dependent receptor [Flavobacterium sp. K5-23]|uniref:TonB-dependent receptor n=1 Tax=Flavobacterium sp. K5-23 TaxID=2746225 RepID=UPI00200D6863|nr:TonB-dependent receptor [Flavobacterium sp. K5-23]UQD55333.1 TonB-dependent receptor [Flavobacterium sp. K5-23]
MNLKQLFFILFPVFTFSQNQIKFKVFDSNLNPLVRAIVVVNQNDKQIGFGTTNNEGWFEKELSNGNYQIKVSKLGFTATELSLVVDKPNTVECILDELANKLETVIITSRPKIMKIKGDTISYNLKTIVDGTENKIEDVIKKLPGLNVDQAGKVSYKGQEIDNILIDGNEFFNNKHQMATQNIDANMVEGIDLLLNHSGFAGERSGADKGIALNLKMKEGFKNKWIGDFEIGSGINNSLKIHNNLFKFFKKGNLALITDYNNIAKTPISIEDYNEMRTVSDINSNNESVAQLEMPSFLNPNGYFTKKENTFIGINYTSRIAEKSKITITNIFNVANSIESQFKNQTNLGESKNQLSFSDAKNATYVLNNTNLKWEFNKSKKTYYSYGAGFTPNVDDENNNIFTSNEVVDTDKTNSNFSFYQQFQVLSKLYEKINYKLSVKHKYVSNDQELHLNSNMSLFGTDLEQINQNFKSKNNFINIINEFSLARKSNLFSLKVSLLNTDSSLKSSITQNNDFDSNLDLDKKSIQINPSWIKSWSSKFQSTIASRISYTDLQFSIDRNSFWRFEPSVNLGYNFNILNKLSFNYSLNHELPSINQLQNNTFISDFQTLHNNSLVSFKQLIPRNEFSLDYLNINTKTQSVFFSKLTYSITEKFISNNGNYQNNWAENQFIITNNQKLLNGMAYYDLKFKKMPFSIKNTFAFLSTDGFSQFNGVNNNVKSQVLSSKQQLISNIKNAWIQFDLGFNFRQTQFNQSINSFSNKTEAYQLSFNLRGKIKDKLKWDIGINRDYQNSSYTSNRIDFLNSNIQYIISKKLKLSCNGFNLLNLDNSKIVKTSFNEIYFTETITKIMPGYILFGLNYSY